MTQTGPSEVRSTQSAGSRRLVVGRSRQRFAPRNWPEASTGLPAAAAASTPVSARLAGPRPRALRPVPRSDMVTIVIDAAGQVGWALGSSGSKGSLHLLSRAEPP